MYTYTFYMYIRCIMIKAFQIPISTTENTQAMLMVWWIRFCPPQCWISQHLSVNRTGTNKKMVWNSFKSHFPICVPFSGDYIFKIHIWSQDMRLGNSKWLLGSPFNRENGWKWIASSLRLNWTEIYFSSGILERDHVLHARPCTMIRK